MNQLQEEAKAVITRIRQGERVAPETSRQFYFHEKLDALRSLITDNDIDRIMHVIYFAEHDDVFRLGVHLLQGIQMFSKNEDAKLRVKGILEGLWAAARTSAYRGTVVAFGLLNVEDLSEDLREALFKFWLDNWEYQCQSQVHWSGGADRVVETATNRLADNRFPSSKRWVYVLLLGASDDPAAVDKTLCSLSSDKDPFIQRAIARVRQHFSGDL